ncbi:S1 family peptidase [Baaleninema sp.]|uniref:S1 family peptidase n=1 Tax=Baaleninema sp. TaxID=3101197 RepID=UPI003D092C36
MVNVSIAARMLVAAVAATVSGGSIAVEAPSEGAPVEDSPAMESVSTWQTSAAFRHRLLENWQEVLQPEAPVFPVLCEACLYDVARAISVKVFSGHGWGTGIIVARQGDTYLVVTNRHVLDRTDDTPQVQTPDEQTYAARERREPSLESYDLALLEFQSSQSYAIAEFGSSTGLLVGTPTVAVGFPLQTESGDRGDAEALTDGFKFTEGEVSLRLDRALEEGYQLGYTNAVEKGMSGGPVLNLAGEVVAINGIHADPLWGDPYIYPDGTRPEDSVRAVLRRSSLAIPSDRILELLPHLAIGTPDSTRTALEEEDYSPANPLEPPLPSVRSHPTP